MLTSREKNYSAGGSEEDRTCDAASRRMVGPSHYRMIYSGPCHYSDYDDDDHDGGSLVRGHFNGRIHECRNTPTEECQCGKDECRNTHLGPHRYWDSSI